MLNVTEEENVAKKILDTYATIVIPRSETYFNSLSGKFGVKAKWKSESHKYQYTKMGYSESLCLWIPPKIWIVIEFEGTREENDLWINETSQNCDNFGLQYCIGDHRGKSAYLWICNVDGLTEEKKKLVVRDLIPINSKLDWTNIGQTLVPIIGHPHWKYGTIHRIIKEIDPLKQRNVFPKEYYQKINQPSSKRNTDGHYNARTIATLSSCDAQSNDKIKTILSSDFLVQRLLFGNISEYESPSHARMALYFCLVGYELSDSEIYTIMGMSKGLNYREKIRLQEYELAKARHFCTQKRKILKKEAPS